MVAYVQYGRERGENEADAAARGAKQAAQEADNSQNFLRDFAAGAAAAGALVAAGLGGRKAVSALKGGGAKTTGKKGKEFVRGVAKEAQQQKPAPSKPLSERFVDDLRSEARAQTAPVPPVERAANAGVQQADLSNVNVEDAFKAPQFQGPRQPVAQGPARETRLPAADMQKSYVDPATGSRSPNVAEFNAITAGVEPETQSQRQLQEYLQKPLGKMGTPQQRPADPALESYVEGRRAQKDPVDRVLAEIEGDRQAQRVREVKEELGGQVLEQLQSEGKPSSSFASSYVRKEGYVDPNAVQTQSNDAMDVDGFQEHREVKRQLQRNEDIDIGNITAKTEPNFGSPNPEQVDDSVEKVARALQDSPVVERTGGGERAETTFQQTVENMDPQGFKDTYVTRLPSIAKSTDPQRDQPGFYQGMFNKETDPRGERRIADFQARREADAETKTVLRRGGDVYGPLQDQPAVEPVLSDKGIRSVENTGAVNFDANFQEPGELPAVSYGASNTKIRGRSRVMDYADDANPMNADPDYQAKSGTGIYGFAGGSDYGEIPSGPINKMDRYDDAGKLVSRAGDYTKTAQRKPSVVFPNAEGQEANPKSFRRAPQYDRGMEGGRPVPLSDETLQQAAQQATPGQAAKLREELDTRRVQRASMDMEAKMRDIRRTNAPDKADALINQFLQDQKGKV